MVISITYKFNLKKLVYQVLKRFPISTSRGNISAPRSNFDMVDTDSESSHRALFVKTKFASDLLACTLNHVVSRLGRRAGAGISRPVPSLICVSVACTHTLGCLMPAFAPCSQESVARGSWRRRAAHCSSLRMWTELFSSRAAASALGDRKARG